MLSKSIQEFKVVFRAVVDSLDSNYGTLFKGAVVLIGVSLAGMVQTYPEITKYDYAARKIQFEVEAAVGKSISEIECKDANQVAANCKLAKYELGANKSAMKLASFIIVVAGYGGLFLMGLSAQGYIVRAIRVHRERT